MNVVEPAIEFCDYSGLRKIELIGKVCTKQEDSIKPDSAETFVEIDLLMVILLYLNMNMFILMLLQFRIVLLENLLN